MATNIHMIWYNAAYIKLKILFLILDKHLLILYLLLSNLFEPLRSLCPYIYGPALFLFSLMLSLQFRSQNNMLRYPSSKIFQIDINSYTEIKEKK